MAAGKKESLFAKKDGDGKKPEPMKNVESPKAEGGEKPAARDEGGEAHKGNEDVHKRHADERAAMHKAHENERRDMHGNHREEHRKLHHRHEAMHKEMHARHAAEMQAAASSAMPAGAGPENGAAGPAAAGATPAPGEA